MLDVFSEWKSVYIDYSGALQRVQIDNADEAAIRLVIQPAGRAIACPAIFD